MMKTKCSILERPEALARVVVAEVEVGPAAAVERVDAAGGTDELEP
jgi:hypothetical protein